MSKDYLVKLPLPANPNESSTHLGADQLVHGIAENSFKELLYSGFKVTSVTIWTNAGKTTKIRDTVFTYTGNKVTTTVTKQYDAAGLVVPGQTMTKTFVYSGNKVSDVTLVMS